MVRPEKQSMVDGIHDGDLFVAGVGAADLDEHAGPSSWMAVARRSMPVGTRYAPDMRYARVPQPTFNR